MAIPMANANPPVAGRGVLAAQGGVPVLGARTADAGATADGFGLAMQAEVVEAGDVAGETESPEAGAATEQATAEGMLLFEDGDAADARRGKPRRDDASSEESVPVLAHVAGPAMLPPQLPFHGSVGGVRTVATTDPADIALRLDGTQEPDHQQGPLVAPAPKAGTGSEARTITLDTAAAAAAGTGLQVLPTTIPLANGMTLNMQPLLQVAGANGGLASGSDPRNALVEQLGERLHVQLTQRSEHALIRLDPPSMGRIEILISQEAGNTQVQMRASHPEVARQLHAIGEQLRQDLVQRQHGEVSVQVQDGWREGEGRGRQRQAQQAPVREEPGHALREEDTEDGEASRFALQS